MAITYIEQGKKQKKLIYVLIIVLLITGFVLWQGVLKKPLSKIREIKGPAAEFKKIEIDFKVLENPILKELQPFEGILPFGEKIGRENPFLPY